MRFQRRDSSPFEGFVPLGRIGEKTVLKMDSSGCARLRIVSSRGIGGEGQRAGPTQRIA